MQTKHLPVLVEKSNDESYDARFIMSAATPDRVKDTIDPDAYQTVISRTKRVIALWQHDSDRPIGYWESLKAEGDKLTGYIKFASIGLAQMVKTLINDGVPLGASIGFRGKGEPNKAGGIHFKEIELLETSIVSVPAHPRAMQIAKQFNITLPVAGEDDMAASGLNRDPAKVILQAKAAILRANKTIRI